MASKYRIVRNPVAYSNRAGFAFRDYSRDFIVNQIITGVPVLFPILVRGKKMMGKFIKTVVRNQYTYLPLASAVNVTNAAIAPKPVMQPGAVTQPYFGSVDFTKSAPAVTNGTNIDNEAGYFRKEMDVPTRPVTRMQTTTFIIYPNSNCNPRRRR